MATSISSTTQTGEQAEKKKRDCEASLRQLLKIHKEIEPSLKLACNGKLPFCKIDQDRLDNLNVRIFDVTQQLTRMTSNSQEFALNIRKDRQRVIETFENPTVPAPAVEDEHEDSAEKKKRYKRIKINEPAGDRVSAVEVEGEKRIGAGLHEHQEDNDLSRRPRRKIIPRSFYGRKPL